jgi:predicted secreted protein
MTPLPGIALLSHCLANQNAKVDEYALVPGVVTPIVTVLRTRGYLIQQMPCPEMCLLGPRRWWQVREQYDTPGFRRHARLLADSVIDVLAARLAEGPRDVVLLGVEGSPSSAIGTTGIGPSWGGRPAGHPTTLAPGRGVWIDELLARITARGFPLPRMIGIPMELPDFDLDASLAELDAFLGNAPAP